MSLLQGIELPLTSLVIACESSGLRPEYCYLPLILRYRLLRNTGRLQSRVCLFEVNFLLQLVDLYKALALQFSLVVLEAFIISSTHVSESLAKQERLFRPFNLERLGSEPYLELGHHA